MFEALFPNWSNPTLLGVLVGLRALINLGLVLLLWWPEPRYPRLAAVEAVGTVGSLLVALLVLRPGGLGHTASLLDLAVQFGMVALAAYAAGSAPIGARTGAIALLCLLAVALGLFMIPIYGEATVAP